MLQKHSKGVPNVKCSKAFQKCSTSIPKALKDKLLQIAPTHGCTCSCEATDAAAVASESGPSRCMLGYKNKVNCSCTATVATENAIEQRANHLVHLQCTMKTQPLRWYLWSKLQTDDCSMCDAHWDLIAQSSFHETKLVQSKQHANFISPKSV